MVQSALVEASSQPPRALRFGIFEMDLDSEELRKNGLIRKLARQPFRMLATIAEAQGKVVTYEELRSKLWSPNVNMKTTSMVSVIGCLTFEKCWEIQRLLLVL
jgi:DNA-binding response OmpR family regulator